MSTLCHELVGEYLQAFNAKGYGEVREAIIQSIINIHGYDHLADRIEAYKDAYIKSGLEKGKTEAQALNEYINDTLATLIETGGGIDNFFADIVKSNTQSKAKSILDKIANFFKGFANFLKEKLGDDSLDDASRDAILVGEKEARRIYNLALNAMNEAVSNKQSLEETDSIEYNSEYESAHTIKVTDKKTLDFLNNQEYIETY
ncbi:MAG: hypothetical protein Q4B73_08885 [Lachnospiraceae bacterium]|nr:hypothetical protein [Lachnospiraceae bacterium]